jgi:hypothetical protein
MSDECRAWECQAGSRRCGFVRRCIVHRRIGEPLWATRSDGLQPVTGRSATLRRGWEFGENGGELLFQLGQVILNRSPYLLRVHTKVLVDEDAAHRDNLCPRHVCVCGPEAFGELGRSLTDDLNVMDDPRLKELVVLKGLSAFDQVFLDLLD